MSGTEIAVIGMAGRFPGAPTVAALWRLLLAGREGLVDLDEATLLAAGVPASLLQNPAYVRRAGILQGFDAFSPMRFGLSAFEAERMDPQHRLFLETVWEALEHAGLAPRSRPGRTGVFAGAGYNGYLQHCLGPRGALGEDQGFATLIMNLGDFLAARAAYALNFTGPAINVQSACSTSLLAVHLACQSLLAGEVDVALAGGVTVSVPHAVGYLYQPGMILAPDGHCRPFDAQAQGTVPGNGCGVVVLRLLEDALADGDPILAVLRGSAANNDGSSKMGFTAPSGEGQAAAIAEAWEVAGLDPASAGYIEAHGTGTELGDPIEARALARVFGQARPGSIALGSIKSNIGHADAAAGIAGLIKAILCLQHGQLVPSLHFAAPNRKAGLEGGPFFVPVAAGPWARSAGPRRAGVSAFGIGGTNVHVVLEEAPAAAIRPAARRLQIFPLSAVSAEALRETAAQLASHLAEQPTLLPAEVAQTLQRGREALPLRRAELGEGLAALGQSLRQDRATLARPGRPVAFLFTGQGSQFPGMSAGLYASEPVYRDLVDRMATVLIPELGLDLRDFLQAPEQPEWAARMADTALAQPLLFVLETALAALWRSWGVLPKAMLGHSVGELACACVAGVFAPEAGARLVATRGRLMAAAPAGAMLALSLDEAEVRAFLAGHPDLDLAVINGPGQCVVAGAIPAVAAAQALLDLGGVACTRLQVARAFHSRLMDGAAAAFPAAFAGLTLQEPALPWLSNETGDWITPAQATDPAYWGRHIRATVRFGQGLEKLLLDSDTALLELGPGATLTQLAASHPAHRPVQPLFASQPRTRTSALAQAEAPLQTLARLWETGVAVDWSALQDAPPPCRVALPATVFPTQRYWLDAPAVAEGASPGLQDLAKGADPDHWLYAPVWRELLPGAAPEPWPICIIGGDQALGQALAAQLAARGQVCLGLAVPGPDPAAWTALLEALPGKQGLTFLNLAGLEPEADPEQMLDRLLFGPMALATALNAGSWPPCRLVNVTQGGWRTLGPEQPSPWPSLSLAAAKILGLEFPDLACQVVDLAPDTPWEEAATALLGALGTLHAAGEEPLSTCRNGRFWRRELAPLAAPAGPSGLRRGGTYVVTGGLGGMGLALARHLAEAWDARLILVSRRTPPRPETWPAMAAGGDPRTARIGRELLAIAAAAPGLYLVQADVACAAELQAGLAAARAELGPIHGCLHCAGLADYGGMVLRRERQATLAVLRPKVQGSLALLKALGDDPLDFLLLCSSLGTILFPTKLGQIGYAAACEFQEGLAEAMAGSVRPRVLTLNWDDWTEAGMSVDAEAHFRGRLGEPLEPLVGLTDRDGGLLLERALATGRPRVAVSVRDLEALRRLAPGLHSQPTENARPQGSRLPRPVLDHPLAPASTRSERVLVELWQEVLGLEAVGVSDDFFALGGHSLLAISLCARIAAAFKVPFGPARLLLDPTVRGCARLLEPQAEAAASPIIRLRRGGPQVAPLFLIHGSDGDILSFRHLVSLLPESLPIHGIMSPGLQDAAMPATLEAMAELYLHHLRRLQPQGPYRLAGLSMGGVLAFEMARRLLAEGEAVAPLILLDAYAPTSPGMAGSFTARSILDALPDINPAEFPPARFQVIEDNLRALYGYRAQPSPLQAWLIKAADQAMEINPDPDLGWGPLLTAGLRILVSPGDHFSLLHPPHVQEVAGMVISILDAHPPTRSAP